MQSNLPAPEAVNDFSLRSIFREFAQSHSVVASRHILFLEQLSMSEFKEILIQSYAAQFIHSLLVQLNLEFKSDNNTQFKDSDVKKVIEIEQRVISNFPKVSPTIKEMSDMAGMSTSKFKIIFFEVFKESPHQHILNKKLLFAKELLQTGQYSIAQVSYKVGFNHPSGFTRLLKLNSNSHQALCIKSVWELVKEKLPKEFNKITLVSKKITKYSCVIMSINITGDSPVMSHLF